MGKPLRAAALGCLLVALAIAVAGCGSSSASPPATTTTTTATGGNQQARGAFTACLATHGVTISGGFGGGRPNGTPPSSGQRSRPTLTAKQQQAFNACRSKLPAGFGQGRRPGGQTTNPALAKYTTCLRQHGVTFGGTSNQTTFAKARTACAKYAPAPASGSSG
jgi:hypothetical protein